MLDPRYQDDSANMVYGYVSSPYGTTNPAGMNVFFSLFTNKQTHSLLFDSIQFDLNRNYNNKTIV